MSLMRRARRTILLTVAAPLAGKALVKTAEARERQHGADATALRLRRAAGVLQGEQLKRFLR